MTMNIWDAIHKMRQLSKENVPFSFSFMSYNSSAGTSEGVVYVRHGRCLQRESERYNRHAEEMERYMDLDSMEPRRFWHPLLMTFNGEKVTL